MVACVTLPQCPGHREHLHAPGNLGCWGWSRAQPLWRVARAGDVPRGTPGTQLGCSWCQLRLPLPPPTGIWDPQTSAEATPRPASRTLLGPGYLLGLLHHQLCWFLLVWRPKGAAKCIEGAAGIRCRQRCSSSRPRLARLRWPVRLAAGESWERQAGLGGPGLHPRAPSCLETGCPAGWGTQVDPGAAC